MERKEARARQEEGGGGEGREKGGREGNGRGVERKGRRRGECVERRGEEASEGNVLH